MAFAGAWQSQSIHLIETLLYQTATALYLPVIAACAGLALYIPLLAGCTLFETVQRRRGVFVWRTMFADEILRLLPCASRQTAIEVERMLQAHESKLARSLDRTRFVIKVGPSLGLMGTLIPMGIALSALSEGDISRMSTSMVTAFTATVAGLFAGVGAYLLALVRERWAREDMREITFLAESFLDRNSDAAGQFSVQIDSKPSNELAAQA